MIGFSLGSPTYRFLIAGAAIAWLLPMLAAQQGQAPADTDQLLQQCASPLGSLVPECQQAKSAAEQLGSPARHLGGDQVVPPTLRIPASRAASGTAGTAGPAVPAPPAPPRAEPTSDAPEPPSQFQRFAASSLGEVLPVFGANLFERVPTTFAPLDRVPVTADYVIGPGDELLLRTWGQVDLDLDLRVDRVGAIFIPQVGNVTVSGLRFQQLSGFLRSHMERVFRNFDLNVNMGELRSVEIFVVGHVRRPGTYTVSSLSTLVNALFASGGPSPQGSMRHIQLKRDAEIVTEFDLYDLLLKGDKKKDARLMPGDVVYVPPVGPQAAVAGSVKNPAIYELNGEKTAGEIIELAGGLSAVADRQRATLERIRNRSSLETIELALDGTGLATAVRDGDVMRVLTITPRFANAVTLRGNVASPGRFAWHAGMKLRDIIPDKQSLITRDYWTKHNILGFAPPEESVAGTPQAEQSRSLSQTTIESMVPDLNWSYAVIERQNPRDLSRELIAFNPSKLVLENDESENLPLRPGDVVTIFSQADLRVAVAQQTRLVTLEGEFHAAGVYAVRPGETLGQLIRRAGGLTPQAYLYGAELRRDSTREDQQRRIDQFTHDLEIEVEQTGNLHMASATTPEETAALTTRLEGQRRLIERLREVKTTGRIVLSLDPADATVGRLMDIALENGDKFLVPPRPATVNVLGAVYNQNSFLYRSDEQVGDYIRSAGGATRNADTANAFVIRADGTVVPKRGTGMLGRGFESVRLNPGDSVVVPEQVFKTSIMRGLRDWTQVFSQLALGAAAISVFR